MKEFLSFIAYFIVVPYLIIGFFKGTFDLSVYDNEEITVWFFIILFFTIRKIETR